MKKLFFVVVLVAVYAISISSVSAKTTLKEEIQFTVVAENDKSIEKDKDEKKKTAGKACCSSKKETKTPACSKSVQKSCAASKKTCGSAEKKSATAKKGCCSGKK